MFPRCAILILSLARVADARRQDVNLVLESLEGIFSENVSESERTDGQSALLGWGGGEGSLPTTTLVLGSGSSQNQSGDVAESSREACPALHEKIESMRSLTPGSYLLNGGSDKGRKGTYISWNVALKQAIADKQDNILFGSALPEGTQAEDVKDVGGKAQKEFERAAQEKGKRKKKERRRIRRRRRTKNERKRERRLKQNLMKDILKVDLENGEYGLLTGGPYAKRGETAAEYNKLCACKNFLPLYPADETEYTMKAAVPAWSNVFAANVANPSNTTICRIVVLMAGSTDLHVGIVSDHVEEFITMIDYKTTPECYMQAQRKSCVETLTHIKDIIKTVGMTVVGGSTEFKLKPAIDRDTNAELPQKQQPTHYNYLPKHGGMDGNAFVYLEPNVLNELPHANVPGLHLTGTVFLAARG